MNRADFEAMVQRMCEELPPEFLDGIAEVVVSARAVPHPERTDIFTLGECIPLPTDAGGAPEDVHSRIVLYHGSFTALAQEYADFDWREEAWETLTHELRHHLEWRARAPDLEAFDQAAEQNFARQGQEAFDPLFYLDGERVDDGVYRIDDDYFLEQILPHIPETVTFRWHDTAYRVLIPSGATLPAFLTVEGVDNPPPGDLVLVLRRKPGLRSLFRASRLFEATVRAERER